MDKMEDDMNINECNINDLLPTLFRLQSQRCLTYQRLYDAQLMFLNTHNFPAFQNFLSDITVIFARISEEILSIKRRFENKKLIYKHIEQLQDYEKKIRNTLTLSAFQSDDDWMLLEEVPMNNHLFLYSNNRLLVLFHQNTVSIQIVQDYYLIFYQEQFHQYPLINICV